MLMEMVRRLFTYTFGVNTVFKKRIEASVSTISVECQYVFENEWVY